MADKKNTSKPAEKDSQPAAKTATPSENKPAEWFIVNPAGAVHQVSQDHMRERIRVAGWRLAEPDEIEAYKNATIQRADRPIAKPFKQVIAEQAGDDQE